MVNTRCHTRCHTMSWLNLNDQQAFGLSANDVFYVSALLFLALKRDRLLPMSLPRPVSWSARARDDAEV